MDTGTLASKDTLKKSFEYSLYKTDIIVYGIFVSILIAFLIYCSVATHYLRFMLISLPSLFAYTPYLTNRLFKMRSITRSAGRCIVRETVLQKPTPGFNASLSFFVKFKHEGRMVVSQTNPIGTTRGLLRPHLSELDDRHVRIAYDTVERQVIILELL